jgi:hypothetical protein
MAASLIRLWLHHRVIPLPPAAMAYPDEPITAPIAATLPTQPEDTSEDAHVG